MSEAAFTKYEARDAYHWSFTYHPSFRRYSPRSHAFYDVPLRLLDARVGRSAPILDVGCGDGVLLYKAFLRGRSPVGIDGERAGLALARREFAARGAERPRVVQASCYDLPFPDASFGGVTSVEVIEHLAEPERYLREIRRVLAPGGCAVLTTPHRRPDGRLQDPFHVREYDSAELRALLAGHFGELSVLGMNPAWLDRVYVRPTGVPLVGRAVRGAFKVFARYVANPYVHAITRRPGYGWANLVAICRPAA